MVAVAESVTVLCHVTFLAARFRPQTPTTVGAPSPSRIGPGPCTYKRPWGSMTLWQIISFPSSYSQSHKINPTPTVTHSLYISHRYFPSFHPASIHNAFHLTFIPRHGSRLGVIFSRSHSKHFRPPDHQGRHRQPHCHSQCTAFKFRFRDACT